VSQLPAEYRDPPPFAVSAQGHELTFYPAGKDRLERLLALLDSAESSIRMCFYIFADDECGRAVIDRLLAARKRGVEVSLLIDSFGSSATPDAVFAPLRDAGCRYCCFSPKWNVRYLVRNHQKLVVIDESVALTGGFNVERDYFAPPAQNGWQDLAVELSGPVVAVLVRWYDLIEKWTRSPKGQWKAIRRLVRAWKPGAGPVQVLVGGPTRGLSPWARAVSDDLIEGHRLDMIMAYFSPAVRLLARIGRIAKRRETRLVLAAKSDNGATIGASRLLYGKLLKRGARIWEFSPTKLHTKLIVLDDTVYMGSANFDMRSLYLNLEIVVAIEDKALADRMRGFVEAHLPASLEVTPEVYRQWATPWNRLRWRASWFLVSVVDYTVSRRLNLGL
jgi:cardiolipin synthase